MPLAGEWAQANNTFELRRAAELYRYFPERFIQPLVRPAIQSAQEAPEPAADVLDPQMAEIALPHAPIPSTNEAPAA